MGKPGQRNPHTPIIDIPELKTPARRMIEGSITAILWAAWIYWILPVVTVILWAAGLRMFYHALFDTEQFRQLYLILRNGGLAILAIFTLNLLWITYNFHFIFRKFGTRRKVTRRDEDHGLAEFYHIDEKILKEAKQHNRFEIKLADKKIEIISATTITE